MPETLGCTSDAFQFDANEAMKTGFYVSGTTGCGKSDIAMYCLDAIAKLGVTCFTFDPTQDWIQRYHFPRVTFKVFNSSAPIRNDLSSVILSDTVFDISNLTILQTQEVAETFSEMLYRRQASISPERRRRYFVLFEEASNIFPQGSLRAKALQNVVRLLTQGRNYGIRMGLVTQFAAMLDKNALRYCRQRYFGWTDEYNDYKYLKNFLGDDAEQLKYLEAGEFLYYYPTKGAPQKIRIEPYASP